MLVLGIETSCDETAAAVVEDGRRILASEVASQLHLHGPFGGVVPEIACRAHVEWITLVIDTALRDAGVAMGDLDGIAVANRPGLIGALMVGVSAAKSLATAAGLPLVGVSHLEAHLYASQLGEEPPAAPYVGMVVSGGHTRICLYRGLGDWMVMGRCLDDAAGEAFDKVAKILGLGYPGGPAVSRAAEKGTPGAVTFPKAFLGKGSFDFSFSGIKTAVLYHCSRGPTGRPSQTRELPVQEQADVAHGFQEAMVAMLAGTLTAAAESVDAERVVVGGGVAANRRLREEIAARAEGRFSITFPAMSLCTDNAAMVAGLGCRYLEAGERADATLDAAASE
jgi:N6-L-threonylcarbamoyladenine synthase